MYLLFDLDFVARIVVGFGKNKCTQSEDDCWLILSSEYFGNYDE